ncbi:MAG: hypothetical protein JWQ23_1858 [Herminiimonas sp.]|nr:hypothetical protein [Herminiimonas sp.]
MAIETTVIALADQVTTNSPADMAPPMMSDDTTRGAARLSELMAVEDKVPEGGVDGVGNSAGAGTGTLGDAILGKLNAVSERYQVAVNDAHKTLDVAAPAPSLPELMRLQLKLATVSLEIEVISKGVSKAVQHVDQLTKLQ